MSLPSELLERMHNVLKEEMARMKRKFKTMEENLSQGKRRHPPKSKEKWKVQREVEASRRPSSRTHGKTFNSSVSNVKSRTRILKCFKCNGQGHYAYACPTKRVMVLKENEWGENEPKINEQELGEGSLLMVRRLQQELPLDMSQRTNVFHARCNVKGRLCSLIIDGGSCANVASSTLVSKLKLETKPHPQPYKLQWLNDNGDLMVNEQVEVGITMGQYNDKVLCDVIPMEVCHILLGRPWQFDKRATHDGFTNWVSFVENKKKFILKPLTPQQVNEDLVRMREQRLGEWSDKRSKDGKKNKNIQIESVEGETLERIEGETRTQLNCEDEVRKNLFTRKPLTFLICKENLFEKEVLPSNTFGKEIEKETSPNKSFCENKILKENSISCENQKDPTPQVDEQIFEKELEENVSVFNETNSLSSFVEDKSLDLRTNPLQEGGDDVYPKVTLEGILEAFQQEIARTKTRSSRRASHEKVPYKLRGTLQLKDTVPQLEDTTLSLKDTLQLKDKGGTIVHLKDKPTFKDKLKAHWKLESHEGHGLKERTMKDTFWDTFYK